MFPQASEYPPEATDGIAFHSCHGVSGVFRVDPAPQAYLRLAELCTIVQYVVIMHAMLKSGELFNRAVSATA